MDGQLSGPAQVDEGLSVSPAGNASLAQFVPDPGRCAVPEFLRHGEAVAIGLALDSRYSVAKGYLGAGNEERICALLEKLGFELWHPALEMCDADSGLMVLAGLREFREHLGGELTITLLTGIGTGHEVNEMEETVILDSLAWLKNRASRR